MENWEQAGRLFNSYCLSLVREGEIVCRIERDRWSDELVIQLSHAMIGYGKKDAREMIQNHIEHPWIDPLRANCEGVWSIPESQCSHRYLFQRTLTEKNLFQKITCSSLLLIARIRNGNDADLWTSTLNYLFFARNLALIGATSSGNQLIDNHSQFRTQVSAAGRPSRASTVSPSPLLIRSPTTIFLLPSIWVRRLSYYRLPTVSQQVRPLRNVIACYSISLLTILPALISYHHHPFLDSALIMWIQQQERSFWREKWCSV